MSIIEFHPGPKLISLKYEGTSSEDMRDVTLHAAQYLFEPVRLKGATLADFFELVRLNAELRIIYRRDFINEFLDEVKKGPRASTDVDPNDSIDYLELYRHWEFDSHAKSFEMASRPSFHGIGVIRSEDSENYKKGERTAWGLMGSSVLELLPLEIKYTPEVTITENDMCTRAYGDVLQRPCLDQVTLGEALSGVFWELSFHGAPSDAQKATEEIQARSDEAKAMLEHSDQDLANCPSKSYSMQEVFGDLYEQEFAAAFISSTVPAHTLSDAVRQLGDNEDACAALFKQFGADSFVPKPECIGMRAIDLRRLIQTLLYGPDSKT